MCRVIAQLTPKAVFCCPRILAPGGIIWTWLYQDRYAQYCRVGTVEGGREFIATSVYRISANEMKAALALYSLQRVLNMKQRSNSGVDNINPQQWR
jgi:hypothetical protein